METITALLDKTELPADELTSIVRQGALLRLPYLESRLLRAQDRVRQYEETYQMTFDQLSRAGLPDDADYAIHEDFVA